MSGIQIGTTVVCIKSHSQGIVKKGDVKTVLGIKKEPCGIIVIDVGIVSANPIGAAIDISCVCGRIHPRINTGIWWVGASLFKPIDKLTTSEVDEILDSILQEKETVK